FPPNPSMRLVTNVFEWCGKNLPSWNSISISGYHIREAGADAAQELAFTISNGIAYVEAAVNAGLNVDDFAPRLSFFFNSHNNFFEEIAKFRAARKMWANIMKERFGAKNPKSMMMRFHVQTAGSTLTSRQIDNNIVRVTLQALAAVLGGCQSLHTNSRDEALALPTEESVRTALRTQQIIAYESGVTDSVDPVGGSGLVEYLTDKLEEKANTYIEEIDSMGGSVKAIEQGYMQHHIAQSSYRYQKEIEEKAKVVVGENMFVVEEERHQDMLRIDEGVRERQVEKLRRIRKKRNGKRVEAALDAIRLVAKGDENIFPFILEAVNAYATIGEIAGALRSVWGEYKG
ncbi:MAG: methylmalonyl-CoA mutase, partial [Chlorobi bacterium]|nr:methylmalonyl-CoA mutase [Chlorobiota bacterium]